MNKQRSHMSIRQIPRTRLVDDGSLELRYEILNKLGKGSFGTVYRVQNKVTDVFYAVKTIPKKVTSCCQRQIFQYFLLPSLETNRDHLVSIMK